jgi:WD40 repeat protein
MKPIPYPGLRPFQADESHLFFGREEHTSQLIEKLGNTHFIAVVGTSGCGKSSLVRAGLLADLETGFLVQAGARWRIAECRPGNHPLTSLAEALLAETAIGPEYSQHFAERPEAKAFLQASLRRGPFSVHELLAETHFPEQTNLLILVDQFEEIFRSPHEKNEIVAFVDLLLTCSKHSQIYIVITMRSDFLGDCALYYGLSEAINQGLFLAPRLTREQLRAAIEGPAQVFGGQVESALVNRLLNEAGNNSDQLPLLQHALMRLWNFVAEKPGQIVLTLPSYEEKIGKLTLALSQHAEEAFGELDEEQQKLAEILFRRLSERGSDNRDTRHPVELQEVAELAKVSWEQVATVVEVFRQEERNFLTPPLGKELAPESLLDISHESLIRQWQRLQQWVKEEAESAGLYRRLEDSARRWETGQTRLWGTPDLEKAQAWRKCEQPTVLWAKRYGINQGEYFDLAMRFLEESEREQQRTRQERELELQRTWRLKSTLRWALGTLVVAVVLAFWAVLERGQAKASEQQTQIEKQKVVQAEKERTSTLFESQLTHAALLARLEDYALAKIKLFETRKLDSKVSASRRHARNLLDWFSNLMGGTPDEPHQGANVTLKAVAVSPDGQWLAAGGEKDTLIFGKTRDNNSLQSLEWEGKTPGECDKTNDKVKVNDKCINVNAVVFHPHGQWFASAGDDKLIILWSLPAGTLLKQWKAPDKVKALAVSPNGKYLASGGEDNQITVWEVETQKPRYTLTGHQGKILDLAFHPTEELLVSASADQTARLWKLTGESLGILAGHTGPVNSVTFSHDGLWIATGSDDKTIRLWKQEGEKPPSWKTLRAFQGHQNKVTGVRFVEKGPSLYLVSASEDHKLRIWDIDSGVTLRVLQGHELGITGLSTDTTGQLFSASSDKTVRSWKIELPHQTIVNLSGEHSITSVAIAPEGNRVAVGFGDGTLRLYSLPDANLISEKNQAPEGEIRSLVFSPNSLLLASGGRDATVKLWQVNKEGKLRLQESYHEGLLGPISSLAFSPNSHTFATASDGGQIMLVDTTQKKQPVFFPEEVYKHKIVKSVAFDSTGNRLLSSGWDGYIRFWEITNAQPTPLNKFPEPPSHRKWAATSLSPDNQQVAGVGMQDSVVHLYAASDGKPQGDLKGHEDTIWRVIFSPDSQQLATVSSDGTVRFWDLSQSRELFTLHLPVNHDESASSWDFDFRCVPRVPNFDHCWIAVPLTQGKLILYELTNLDN